MPKIKSHVYCVKCWETNLKKIYRYPNGRYSSYCRKCDNIRRRESYHRLKNNVLIEMPIPEIHSLRNRIRFFKFLFIILLILFLFLVSYAMYK